MLTLLFIILMFGIFGKMIGLAFRATWGITKICFRLVFLPLVLIGLVLGGLIYIAIPLLVIAGIAMLVLV
nr:hypothetical protein [uncultured Blautia sp.]